MQLLAGTSGYAYKEWKGSFYPDGLPQAEMLSYYSGRLPAVEINNTFYRMPRESVLEGWAAATGEGFRFVLKASRRITHFGRLKNVEDLVQYVLDTAGVLGPKLGALLFQLPPNLRKDAGLLAAFLDLLPPRCRAGFEFRHASWFDEEIYALLADHGEAALVAGDEGPVAQAPLTATAGWGYLRLRRGEYEDAELGSWVERVRAQSWRETYVFFKHEAEGSGPALAERFAGLFAAG